MPLAAPVTTTTLPSTSPMGAHQSLGSRRDVGPSGAHIATRTGCSAGLEGSREPFHGVDVLVDEVEHDVAHGPDRLHRADDLTDGRERQVLAMRPGDPGV